MAKPSLNQWLVTMAIGYIVGVWANAVNAPIIVGVGVTIVLAILYLWWWSGRTKKTD